MLLSEELSIALESGRHPGADKLARISAQDMANKDFDDMVREGEMLVANAFVKAGQEYVSFLRGLTAETWKGKITRGMFALTSVSGRVVDIYWDWDPVLLTAAITVEAVKKSARFDGKPHQIARGGTAAKYLGWLKGVIDH